MTKTWMKDKEYKFVTDKTPVPCVDLVILRGDKSNREVLLLIRKTGYEKGKWCIIGGRVWIGETIENAIARQAGYLGVMVSTIAPFTPGNPVWVNGNPNQDATKHSITSVYPVTITEGKLKDSGEEYSAYKWFPVDNLPDTMAFDHKKEILTTIEKLSYASN
jgi:ADP-ribose pyrophosphatase YjhB (NUDIX family)